MLIDGLLACVVALPIAFVLGTPPAVPGFVASVLGRLLLSPLAVAAFAATTVVVSVLHHAVFVPWRGGTLGELVWGIRAAGPGEGGKVGVLRAIVRGAVGATGALLCLAGPLYAFWLSADGRGPGDIVARVRPQRRRNEEKQ